MTQITVISCDKCGEQISLADIAVYAGVYGAEFHLHCIRLMSADELIIKLGLDDIKIMKHDDWQNAEKANTFFRRNRS